MRSPAPGCFPADPALDFKITRSDGTTVLPASAAALVAVLRIR